MSSYSSSFFEGTPEINGCQEFGKPARDLFYLEEGTAFTNHGSYGTVPCEVLEERHRLLTQVETHPNRWFMHTVRPLYDRAVEDVAEFVGANPRNLVFVQNATMAINTVVKGLSLGPEDIFLLNSHSYNACKNAIECAVKKAGADTLSLDISLPIRSEKEIVDQVVDICKRNVGIRLAMVDHISSPSAIVFPIAEIAKELHKLGVLLLVDGAHAPGQLELDLESLGADFYTGNLHKWCFAPRGSAFLWVSPTHRNNISPLCTSHAYKEDMVEQFFQQGSMDHTPYLCSPVSLSFYKRMGGREAMLAWTTPLLDWAQQMLCHAFGTPVLPIPPSMQAPFMRVLRLPDNCKYSPICHEQADKFMDDLVEHEKVVAVISVFSGHFWLRISASIYNCKEDYLQLRDVLQKYFNV